MDKTTEMHNKANDLLAAVLRRDRSNLTCGLVHEIGQFLFDEGYTGVEIELESIPDEVYTLRVSKNEIKNFIFDHKVR
jgi:hypothetical protein